MRMQLLIVSIFTLVILPYSLAQDAASIPAELNIEDFCVGPSITLNSKLYLVKEDGFCNAIKNLKEENSTPDSYFIEDINYTFANLDPTDLIAAKECQTLGQLKVPKTSDLNLGLNNSLRNNDRTKWQIRLYASHSFTTYGKSDFKMRSSRINIDVKDSPIFGRDGHHWFNPKTFLADGHNPAQMIDEPSNTFTIGFIKPSKSSKISHEFILSAFHPKELYQTDGTAQVNGTVDGVEVNGVVQMNKPFDGYNQTPGELEIARNESTYQNMIYTVGYRPRFKLLDGKAGSLIYSPGIELGVATGKAYSSIVKEDEWWDFDSYEEAGTANYHGYGGAVTNKVEYLLPGGKFGIHYENKLGAFKKKIPFLDGTQEYTMKFMGNSIGMTFMIRDFNVSKKERQMKRKSRKQNKQ